MTSVRVHLRRVLPALACVALVGLLVALSAWATGRVESASIALAGMAIAALVVIVSEAVSNTLGDSPEYALVRLMASMTMRGFAAVAAIAGAILLLGCEPRTVALIALPIYFATLVGEVWEALARVHASPAAQGLR